MGGCMKHTAITLLVLVALGLGACAQQTQPVTQSTSTARTTYSK